MVGDLGITRQNIRNSKMTKTLSITLLAAGSTWFFPLFGIASHDAAKPATNCPPLDKKKLKEMVEESEGKKVDLVFFSSWCSDCGNHLKKLEGPGKVLVGTFDKQPRIEKLVGKLKLPNRCFTDSGVAKKLKVTTVPAERSVTQETLSLLQN
jgi:hypothetical protein